MLCLITSLPVEQLLAPAGEVRFPDMGRFACRRRQRWWGKEGVDLNCGKLAVASPPTSECDVRRLSTCDGQMFKGKTGGTTLRAADPVMHVLQ